MAQGKLHVTGTKIELKYTNAKQKQVTAIVSRSDLSRSLANIAVAKLHDLDVDFDLVAGAVKKIRPVDQPFETTTGGSAAPPSAGQPTHPQAPRQAAQSEKAAPLPGEFHNPYNFVPAPPRDKVTNELRDHTPVGHDRYQLGHYSGTIRVKLTTITPLLLPDAAALTEDAHGHKTFPVRLGKDGRPCLPETSVKGMIRAAYEAVTNSRFGVFPFDEDRATGHAARLAMRTPASGGLRLVPARVIGTGSGAQLELLAGTSSIQADGRPTGPMMYAAWLHCYDRSQRMSWGPLLKHGQFVWAYLTRWRHTRPDFSFWNVVALRDGKGAEPTDTPRDDRRFWPKGSPDASPKGHWVQGHICVTGCNIDRKHDERVFFTTTPTTPVPLSDEVVSAWRELIRNYQEIHVAELLRNQPRPPALADWCEWSRHVTAGEDEQTLKDGTLCYAQVQQQGNTHQVLAVYPVMISRDLHEVSPLSLLPDLLRPPGKLAELSPADRVFGWVNQNGNGAYRGNLRVGPVACLSADALVKFDPPGLPLAILGQPKPQQVGFYGAASPLGEAHDHGGYHQGKGLRGRKVYPHHGSPDGYWNEPLIDRTQQNDRGHFQEYRRPRLKQREQCDDQNRSILGWVRPGAEFEFDLAVTNLSAVELGALLWLLDLPAHHYHRLGGGKPLGFGSVRLDIVRADLRTGEQWAKWYESLDDSETTPVDRPTIKTSFETAVAEAYGQGRPCQEVSFIKAFLRAAQGFSDGLPIHYPRTSVSPLPEGLAYEWFVANNREGRDAGPHLPLPELVNDTGLPILERPDR